MSAITDEIVAIETEINKCFDTDSPIDPKKLVRLCDLRVERAKELASTHHDRSAIMKGHTRTLTSKLTGLKSKGRPDILERIHAESDNFDKAAVHWVISETCSWEESQACAIYCGILILVADLE